MKYGEVRVENYDSFFENVDGKRKGREMTV